MHVDFSLASFAGSNLWELREMKCFFEGWNRPHMWPSPTSEPHCPWSGALRAGEFASDFFLLNACFLPGLIVFCDGKLSSFRVRPYFGAEDRLCSNSPLFLHITSMKKNVEFVGPGLCGNIFTCGTLEDGSQRIWIILRITFSLKKSWICILRIYGGSHSLNSHQYP